MLNFKRRSPDYEASRCRRRLSRRDCPALRAHLTGLDAQGRRLRFGCAASDRAIAAYVASIDWRHAVLFGQFEAGQLVGLAELIATPPHWARCAEIAVSVACDARGQGVGSALLSDAITYAKTHRVRRVRLLISPQNQPMLHLAAAQGAQLRLHHDEVAAQLRLPPAQPSLWRRTGGMLVRLLTPWGRKAHWA